MITAAELVENRLSVVLASPGSAHAWHRLYHATVHLGTSTRRAVVDRIRTNVEFSNLAGVLAGTFLHALTDELEDLQCASRAFSDSELPLDAGLALLHTVYATALISGSDDHAFHDLVRRSGFLEVSRAMGARLRDALHTFRVSPASQVHSAGRLRVAVVAPSLSSAFHAPTTMALQHARLLASHGCEVSMFGAQEFQMLDMAQWLGVPRAMNLDPAEPAQWPPSGVAVPVVLAPRQLLSEGRWRQLLREIEVFAPDVVFFIGPYSPLLEALHARYPVAGLGTNALAPIGPMDVWLAPECAEQSLNSSEGAFKGVCGGPWRDHDVSRRIRYTHRFAFDEPVQAMERSSLQLPQDACVWVTVGTRLHSELNAVWVGEVRQVLDRNPGARWLLVGQERQQLQGLGLDHPQILIRPFERQVQHLLKACDLYLNPPRRGGGHSVACAMFNGLAVLSMRTGDGGDKVGPWGAADGADYFERLQRLSEQPEELRALGLTMQKRFAATFDMLRAGDFLLHSMHHTMEWGASRLR